MKENNGLKMKTIMKSSLKKKKITRVTIHKDHYWFGGFEY